MAHLSPRRFLPWLILTLLASLSLTVSAQATGNPAQMVKDINPNSASSMPSESTEFGGAVYFFADNGSGKSLWKSQGTADNTNLVRAVTWPSQLVQMNGMLYFIADDWSSQSVLWKSDGTSTGTLTVGPYAAYSDIDMLTVVGNTLFFRGLSTDGSELWKSDGTHTGTGIVKDINPGFPSSGPQRLTNVDGRLFFMADDGLHGNELWKSDGTSTGTVMVKDITPGPSPTNIQYLANLGGKVFVVVMKSLSESELWVSDGTEAGTLMLKPINVQGVMTVLDDRSIFAGNDGTTGTELWISDGTASGTKLLKEIYPGATGSDPNQFMIGSHFLLFGATDGGGRKLWRTDGTATGTVPVKDVSPFGGWFTTGYYAPMPVSSAILFAADDGIHGVELWQSDGTTAGTMLLQDIAPGAASSTPRSMARVGQKVYFAADDSVHGQELWALDLALRDLFLPSITR